jgi:hypothetical protein
MIVLDRERLLLFERAENLAEKEGVPFGMRM